MLPGRPGEFEAAASLVAASDRTVLPSWRPGRGSGAITVDEGETTVMVPRAPVLLEAFLRLYARDADKQIGSFAMAMVDYMELYVDGDGLLDVTQLPNPIKHFYQELKEGDKSVSQWTKELQEALGVHADDAHGCLPEEEEEQEEEGVLPFVSGGEDGDSVH